MFPWLERWDSNIKEAQRLTKSNRKQNSLLLSHLKETLNPQMCRGFVDAFLVRQQNLKVGKQIDGDVVVLGFKYRHRQHGGQGTGDLETVLLFNMGRTVGDITPGLWYREQDWGTYCPLGVTIGTELDSRGGTFEEDHTRMQPSLL